MADTNSRRAAALEPEADVIPAESGFATVEHSLGSLLDLARGLSVSLELQQTADLLLFNLMGHLATGRAALWLMPRDGTQVAVLLRSHGFDRDVLKKEAEALRAALLVHFGQGATHATVADLAVLLNADEMRTTREAGMALFAPLLVQSEVFGWLALGTRLSDEDYSATDLEFIEAALGIGGLALQNARLHTEVLEANRQLHGSNVHLLEVDRLKSEFLSNVNHELRTPLTVIMATLECLAVAERRSPSMQSLVSSAFNRAQHLEGLLENLMTFSEAVSSRMAIALADLDVARVLDGYYAQRRPGVTAGLREFAFLCESGLPKVRCDSRRLLQILDQLLDNAVKFTPSGAHLSLRASRAMASDRAWVSLEVEDDGPGIPPERLDTVFNSFEQVDGSHTRKVGGLGMGLALAQQLAVRMECRLSVRSTVGGGSTFTLLIPAVS